MSLNWFMPALVNSRVSSPSGTTGELGTNVCSLALKNSMNPRRISLELSILDNTLAKNGSQIPIADFGLWIAD